jgi:hypothetical protein
MASELRVGTDASGSACWEVEIDGIIHRSRSADTLRALMEAHFSQKSNPNPCGRWAPLEAIEGLCSQSCISGCDRCQIQPEPTDH